LLYTRPPRLSRFEGEPFSGDAPVVVPVAPSGDGVWLPDGVPEDVASALGVLKRLGVFKGEAGTSYVLPRGSSAVILAGVGRPGGSDLEGVRRGFGQAGRVARKCCGSVVAYVEGLGGAGGEEAVIALGLGAYKLEAFKSKKTSKLSEVLVAGDVDVGRVSAVLEGVYLARDVANAPPGQLSPPRLAGEVERLFSGLPNVEVEVFDYGRLVREGFGGIVAVGRGSEEKPTLTVIRYRGGGRRVALVGKTVVFDSGGINLKPSQGITYMRADKAGGAAVLGTVWAAAKLGLPVDLYALVPAVINVPSGSSYLPSDVIKMWDGTWVEVTNTDAEGRLIVADAVAYAVERLGAEVVIDVATLTGAIVVALGPLVAGLFTRDEELARAIEEAGEATGERVWRMPMVDDYAKPMESNALVGDIINAWQRYGGAIFGALFIERFAHGRKHAHLDIAGPGIAYEAGQLTPPHWPDTGLAPGYGVRLLLETLRRLSGSGG
jgi:leucyl aminopeptidase